MRISMHDGTTLAYDDVGTGDRAVVLIHGLGCDRTTMAPQVDHLRSRYRVVNIDLRGHGGSDKPDVAYHPDLLARDVEQICTSLDLRRPLLVGHSLGGVVGLRLAHLYPGALTGLVALDSAIAVPAAVAAATPGLVARLATLEGDDYRSAVTDVLGAFFLPTDDPSRRDHILTMMSACPKNVFLSGWLETVGRTDTVGPLATLTIPMLYVAAATPNGNLDVIRGGPMVAVAQTCGTGHFVEVECPGQVNAMIDTFARVIEFAAAGTRSAPTGPPA